MVTDSAVAGFSPTRPPWVLHRFLVFRGPAAAEPPPETTKIRLVRVPAICLAPEYLAEELLRLEGFTDVEYVEITTRANSR